MDVTWHVKNGCNGGKRSRRSVDIAALTADEDRYFYKGNYGS